MINMIIFLNFMSFIYIILGININYPTLLTKKIYNTLFSTFILIILIAVIPYSNQLTDYISNFLEITCIVCTATLFYFLRKYKTLNKRSNLAFLVFLSTQILIIIKQLYLIL